MDLVPFLPQSPPFWMTASLWTAVIVGVAYLVGHLVRAFASARLMKLAARTEGDWDDVLVSEFSRRIPFWSVLVGVWLALPQWPLGPDAKLFAARVISAVGVASVTFAAATVAARLAGNFGPRADPKAPVSGLTQNIARVLVIFLGILVIIRSFGYDITPYLTALGVGGLAVALALQDPLSNFFAGLSMTLSGQVRIGDYVKLDSGAEGAVTDFDWRATTIRTLSGSAVVVPNAKLAQAIVTNFHRPARDLAVLVELGVEYTGDLDRVERITTEVATDVMRNVPGAVRDFSPFIRFHTFGPTSVNFSVVMRSEEFTDQFLVKHEFIKRLHKRYLQEGIVIPTPKTALDLKGPISVNVLRRQSRTPPP